MRLVMCAALAACGVDPHLVGSATRVVELDAVFRQEPHWLGGDGAYAIDLGADRTLWLFGDSFVATSPAHVRTESRMVRNTVGVMTGRDLATATMELAWRDGDPPTSFIPEDGELWFWPSGGARVPDGSLVVFVNAIRATAGEGLGFAGAGFRALRVPDPSGPPATWQLEWLPYRRDRDTLACVAVEGDELIAVVAGDRAHASRLARWSLASVATGEPAWTSTVIEDGATECSLHRDRTTGIWVYLWSRGFGATTIAMRTARDPSGPWSDPVDLMTPPESRVDGAFVYAAKAHPFLPIGDAIAVTFADNSFTFADLLDPARSSTLYWPHVAALELWAAH